MVALIQALRSRRCGRCVGLHLGVVVTILVETMFWICLVLVMVKMALVTFVMAGSGRFVTVGVKVAFGTVVVVALPVCHSVRVVQKVFGINAAYRCYDLYYGMNRGCHRSRGRWNTDSGADHRCLLRPYREGELPLIINGFAVAIVRENQYRPVAIEQLVLIHRTAERQISVSHFLQMLMHTM